MKAGFGPVLPISISADFGYFQIVGVLQPPFPVEDTMSPIESVHAYPNKIAIS
jgi:hypothetical protein